MSWCGLRVCVQEPLGGCVGMQAVGAPEMWDHEGSAAPPLPQGGRPLCGWGRGVVWRQLLRPDRLQDEPLAGAGWEPSGPGKLGAVPGGTMEGGQPRWPTWPLCSHRPEFAFSWRSPRLPVPTAFLSSLLCSPFCQSLLFDSSFTIFISQSLSMEPEAAFNPVIQAALRTWCWETEAYSP